MKTKNSFLKNSILMVSLTFTFAGFTANAQQSCSAALAAKDEIIQAKQDEINDLKGIKTQSSGPILVQQQVECNAICSEDTIASNWRHPNNGSIHPSHGIGANEKEAFYNMVQDCQNDLNKIVSEHPDLYDAKQSHISGFVTAKEFNGKNWESYLVKASADYSEDTPDMNKFCPGK